MPLLISLFADRPEFIASVADMRWREWGHPPEPEDLSWWLETTSREAGRSELPVTFLAVDDSGEVVGAVGLDHYDLEERRETSPWVTGMIVRADRRGAGAGRDLLSRLEGWACEHGIGQVWVGTGAAASGFYQRCGWSAVEVYTTGEGQRISVLHKTFP